MKLYKVVLSLLFISIFIGCNGDVKFTQLKNDLKDLREDLSEEDSNIIYQKDSSVAQINENRRLENQGSSIHSSKQREELVSFASNYQGTPYLYAGTTPETGFDCSGFINYVYNHFGYKVPRSSKDFEFFGKEISIQNAQI